MIQARFGVGSTLLLGIVLSAAGGCSEKPSYTEEKKEYAVSQAQNRAASYSQAATRPGAAPAKSSGPKRAGR